MGKSNKKSNVKVAAVTPTIPLVQGKKAKRQPESAVGIQPLHKKLKSATKVPQKKKHETSPSSEEASESEEEGWYPLIMGLRHILEFSSRNRDGEVGEIGRWQLF